jgi:TIR domain-containing protein
MSTHLYWAFISYSQRDTKWAQWLHKQLETYHVPRSLVGRRLGDLTVPHRLVPVFRDRDELPSTGNLGGKIREALAASRSLIVICSPNAATSAWVNEEVRAFKALGRSEQILPLIVDGDPYASDHPERVLLECFPAALRFAVDAEGRVSNQRADPLAADARDGKDGRPNALLKVIAGILGIGFDDLRQRERARQMIRRLELIAGSVALVLVLAFGYVGLADANVPIYGGTEIRDRIDHYGWSVFRPVLSHNEMLTRASELRAALRNRITNVVKTRSIQSQRWQDAFPSVWGVAQEIAAIYRDPGSAKNEREALLPLLDQMFQDDFFQVVSGKRVGWRDTITIQRAETPIWAIMALTQVIHRARDDPESKAKFLRYLDAAQEIADQYRPLSDGGWNIAREDRPDNHQIYTTTLALHALLELRASDLCWHANCTELNNMIRASVAWLADAFVDRGVMAGGWRSATDDMPPNRDLSIFVFGALGRASVDLKIELPSAIEQEAIKQLIELEDHTYLPSQQEIAYSVQFADEQGWRSSIVTTRVFWYPWAIEALPRWLQYAHQHRSPPEITTALNRSLTHILRSTSDAMLDDMTHSLMFVRAETLYGIDGFQ